VGSVAERDRPMGIVGSGVDTFRLTARWTYAGSINSRRESVRRATSPSVENRTVGRTKTPINHELAGGSGLRGGRSGGVLLCRACNKSTSVGFWVELWSSGQNATVVQRRGSLTLTGVNGAGDEPRPREHVGPEQGTSRRRPAGATSPRFAKSLINRGVEYDSGFDRSTVEVTSLPQLACARKGAMLPIASSMRNAPATR
jgi:hypothetical protein